MPEPQLTVGFITERLFDSTANSDLIHSTPTLQVCSVKAIRDKKEQLRYRLIMSDGIRFTQAMLAIGLNNLVGTEMIKKFCVVVVKSFTVHCNEAATKRLVVLSNLQVIAYPSGQIGSPEQLQLPSAAAYTAKNTAIVSKTATTKASQQIASPDMNSPQRNEQEPALGSSSSRAEASGYTPTDIAKLDISTGVTTIRVAVAGDPTLRSIRNGQSKILALLLKDASGEIRATAWGADAERIHSLVKQGQSYWMTNFRVKPADSSYNTTKHTCEIGLLSQTKIEECDHVPSIQNLSLAPRPSSSQVQAPPGPSQFSATQPPGPQPLTSIADLNPYTGNVTICAAVETKSELKSIQSRSGKMLTLMLKDVSGKIRATAWGSDANRVHGQVREGSVYWITNFRVQTANAQFNTTTHTCEVTFSRDTRVVECEDTPEAAEELYHFVPLENIHSLPKGSICDVIGLVTRVGDVSEVLLSNRKVKKRLLSLTDKTGSVNVTLWSERAATFVLPPGEGDANTIIAFSQIKVDEFGGVHSLSALASTVMLVNPGSGIPAAGALRAWYEEDGIPEASQSQSQYPYPSQSQSLNQGEGTTEPEMWLINDVRVSGLGIPDFADGDAGANIAANVMFKVQAILMHIRGFAPNASGREPRARAGPGIDGLVYPGCNACRRRLLQRDTDWWCKQCNQAYETPMWRYMLSLAMADMSGEMWLSAFEEAGRSLFGIGAQELVDMKNRSPEEYIQTMQQSIGKTYDLTCRAKQTIRDDAPRVDYEIRKVAPIDYDADAKYLKELLNSSWAQ